MQDSSCGMQGYKMAKNIHEYDDIINLPHHQSPTRQHMSNHDRAAQFSPFAALVGYGDAVQETARLTDERTELNEDARAALDTAFQSLQRDHNGQQVSITYFKRDLKKVGGAYLSATGNIKKTDVLERTIMLDDGTVIPMDDILDIQF